MRIFILFFAMCNKIKNCLNKKCGITCSLTLIFEILMSSYSTLVFSSVLGYNEMQLQFVFASWRSISPWEVSYITRYTQTFDPVLFPHKIKVRILYPPNLKDRVLFPHTVEVKHCNTHRFGLTPVYCLSFNRKPIVAQQKPRFNRKDPFKIRLKPD